MMAELGTDAEYLISRVKQIVDNGKKASDRIRALQMLWDAYGVCEEKPDRYRGLSSDDYISVLNN